MKHNVTASMNDDPTTLREQRVSEVLAAYLAELDAGGRPDPAELLRRHPELASELERFFDDCRKFEKLADRLPRCEVAEPFSLSATTAEDPVPVGSRVGDFQVLDEIGRGGMGVVYRARQDRLNRLVALKTMRAGTHATAEDFRRFRTEAETAATLDHPGIVPIYSIGEEAGMPYFAMALVDGPSLEDRLSEGPLPPGQAAGLLRQVALAVQYAHERGVLHRDLKPANVLLEPLSHSLSPALPSAAPTPAASLAQPSGGQEPRAGDPEGRGTPARLGDDFRPRLTDFGLARWVHDASGATLPGQILGTPGYMSPEQASGDTGSVGIGTDIYALGAILYHALTGRPPFQADSFWETLSQLRDGDPPPPRLLNRRVPRDLEAVCLKCLEKDPRNRYASARDLADDLQRHLEGEAVTASGINVLERVARALQPARNDASFRRWGWALLAFALVILLSHVGIYWVERRWPGSPTGYFLPRTLMFTALLSMLWAFRQRSILPGNRAERLVWVVWIGYVLALGAANMSHLVLGHPQRELYPLFAILSGFGFLVMGGHVWGGGYLVGVLFLLAAPCLARFSEQSPWLFGLLWACGLATFGLHYCRMSPTRGRDSS